MGVDSNALPTPNMLTADTLNWYSFVLMSLVALKVHCLHSSDTKAQEILDVSRFSMMKCDISEHPSFSGGLQDKVILPSEILLKVIGPSGSPGVSYRAEIKLINKYSDVDYCLLE